MLDECQSGGFDPLPPTFAVMSLYALYVGCFQTLVSSDADRGLAGQPIANLGLVDLEQRYTGILRC